MFPPIQVHSFATLVAAVTVTAEDVPVALLNIDELLESGA
jgi:hypothetical protein